MPLRLESLGNKSVALVAMLIFLVLDLLAAPSKSRQADLPAVEALSAFVGAIDVARGGAKPAAVPALSLSAFPLAAHGGHGRIFAGLLALHALGSASKKLPKRERALYLESVAALLEDLCGEITMAGQQLAATDSTGGWLGVVEVFRKDAAKDRVCKDATLNTIFLALGHFEGQDTQRAREYGAARVVLQQIEGSVSVLLTPV
jgi:hypothetical protein